MSDIEDNWTEDQTRKLICEIRKYPCLYDPWDGHFDNEPKRAEKLQKILQEIKAFKSNVTEKDIERKIETLEDRLSCSNTNSSDSLQNEQSLSEDPQLKKGVIMGEKEVPSILNEVGKKILNEVGKINDDGTVFVKAWALQYNELTANQKLLTRKIFSDVLFHGGLGNLTQNIVRNIQNVLDT